MKTKYIQIGLNIRFYRACKEINQELLAEKADITTVYLSKIENGHAKPSLDVIFKIAEALEVSEDKLFMFRK